jgi:hypothetical protein
MMTLPVALALLFLANQVPACPSALYFAPSTTPNFSAYSQSSACEALPRVVFVVFTNIVVLACEVVLTGTVIGLDHRLRKKEAERQPRLEDRGDRKVEQEAYTELDKVAEVEGKSETVGSDRYVSEQMKLRRRWRTGVGQLLWEIEGVLATRKLRELPEDR